MQRYSTAGTSPPPQYHIMPYYIYIIVDASIPTTPTPTTTTHDQTPEKEWQAFVKALQLPRLVGWLLTFPPLLPLVLKLLLKAGSPVGPVGHALTRLTMSPNALVGAVKDNVVPGVCTVSNVKCCVLRDTYITYKVIPIIFFTETVHFLAEDL